MPSVVEICNMALSNIGNSQRITDLDERSAEARQCKLFYEQTRDMVLRDGDWPFATKYEVLAEVTDNRDPTNPYSYAMPDDCLNARRIVNQVWPHAYLSYPDAQLPQIPGIPFRVIQGASGRVIATAVAPATLEYTAKVEDTNSFDPMFVEALTWKLAVKLAIPLSKEPNVTDRCEQQYQFTKAKAFALAMNEGQPERMPESTFITGRY